MIPSITSRPPSARDRRRLASSSQVSLAATVSDDGHPLGAAVTSTWTILSGPGAVAFADPYSPATTASFSQVGTYVLRITADDSYLTWQDQCLILVGPPTVNAGADQTTMLRLDLHHNPLPLLISLAGSTGSGGASTPPFPLPAKWRVSSAPSGANVVFADSNSLTTTATFMAAGIYVLRLTVGDAAVSAWDEMTVTVKSPGDFDDSGKVDGADYLTWQRYYNHGAASTHGR